MKLSSLFALVAVTATLAACGGGGGGSDAAAPAATPVVSGYDGNWIGLCTSTPSILVGTVPVYSLAILNVTTVTATAVSGDTERRIFDNASCTGTAKATHKSSFSFTIDGTTILDGKTADKVTFKLAAIGGLSAGEIITINGVTYPGDFFTKVSEFRTLFLIEGNKWFEGADAKPLPAPYPTTLSTTSYLTRQ
jgi:hypothetical protein